MRSPEFRVTVTVHNAGPHTIWGKLAARLGREPTNAEAAAEVRRILSDRPAVSGEYARSNPTK